MFDAPVMPMPAALNAEAVPAHAAPPAPPAAAAASPPLPGAGAEPAAAALRAKPVIERGFNPAAPSAKPVRPTAPGKFAAPAGPALTAPKPGLGRPASAAPQPPPMAAAVPPSAAPAKNALAQLGVTKPAAANPAPAPPVKPAPFKSGYPAGVASVMMMEVEQSPFAAAPVLEEAAILYANGQDLIALAALSDALQNAKMPNNSARQAYSLLFDLYENMGHSGEFDTAAVEFAVRFETSPPAYTDRSSVKDPSLATGSGQYFALTGVLDAASEKLFAQLAKIAARSKILRIEFGKVEAVAEAGCAQLLSHLISFKKTGHDLVFSSSEHLITLLNSAIETGRRSDPEVYWLLLLEMYQFQFMQAAFEETALNYCITYEVSPPSWTEPAKQAVSTPPVKGAATLDVPQDAIYLKGEITGPSDLLFNDIAAHAGGKSLVVIDMFAVKRIDFIAAGAFLNIAQNLRGMQKEIEIRSPSPLLAALLVSMGFLNHVKLTRRGG